MKQFVGFLIGMFLMLCIGTANATVIEIGDTLELGSWGQQFNETGVGDYNKMEAFMVSSGDFFEPTGFEDFNQSGWTGSLIDDDYILATGSNQTNMNFNIHFGGDQSDPLEFVFLAWLDDTLLESALASWNGSAWSFGTYQGNVYDLDRSAPVPEPATMILFGLGLLGLAGVSRKKP
jgi:hypothetical protein